MLVETNYVFKLPFNKVLKSVFSKKFTIKIPSILNRKNSQSWFYNTIMIWYLVGIQV